MHLITCREERCGIMQPATIWQSGCRSATKTYVYICLRSSRGSLKRGEEFEVLSNGSSVRSSADEDEVSSLGASGAGMWLLLSP